VELKIIKSSKDGELEMEKTSVFETRSRIFVDVFWYLGMKNRIILNPCQRSPVSFHIFSNQNGVQISNRDLTPTLGLFNEYLEETFHRFKIESYADVERHFEILEKYKSHSKYQKTKEDFEWVAEVYKMIFFYHADISIFIDEPCFDDFSYYFQTFLTKIIENHSQLILPDSQLILV
jgi:hypothetical protein